VVVSPEETNYLDDGSGDLNNIRFQGDTMFPGHPKLLVFFIDCYHLFCRIKSSRKSSNLNAVS
jgi:hypothetical protein